MKYFLHEGSEDFHWFLLQVLRMIGACFQKDTSLGIISQLMNISAHGSKTTLNKHDL